MPRVLGVIPARGGSKGIPAKNLALLGGKPLLAWTCEAAARSHTLTRTVVSTDPPAIADVARQHGIEAPFLRPPELSTDDSPTLPAIQHAVRFVESEGFAPEAVVILQPTSPLRTEAHIDAGVRLLFESGADSVVSVVEVPHNFHPMSVMRIEEGRLTPYLEGQGTKVLRRQDKPAVYARNGAALYVIRRDVLMGGSLFGEDCRPLLMTPGESIDADSADDLRLAEAMLRR